MSTVLDFINGSSVVPEGVLIRNLEGKIVFDDTMDVFLNTSLSSMDLQMFNWENFASDNGGLETWLTARMTTKEALCHVVYYGKLEPGFWKMRMCNRGIKIYEDCTYDPDNPEESNLVGYNIVLQVPMGNKYFAGDAVYVSIDESGEFMLDDDNGIYRIRMMNNGRIIVSWER